jgi:hypothetical protein
VDEVNLLLQGLSVPNPPLAADEPLPEPLQLQPNPMPVMPPPVSTNPSAPSTSVVAEDPELAVIVENAQRIPSNCKYIMNHNK